MPAKKIPRKWHQYIDDERELGGRLWARMVERKVTPNELAEVLEVSVNAVSQLLKGKANDMKSKNLFRAADFLEIEARWLGTGEGRRLTAGLQNERKRLVTGKDGGRVTLTKQRDKIRTAR